MGTKTLTAIMVFATIGRVADIATTYYALEHRTGFVEVNPITRGMLTLGWPAMILSQILIVGIIWGVYKYVERTDRAMTMACVGMTTGAWWFVSLHNLWSLLK